MKSLAPWTVLLGGVLYVTAATAGTYNLCLGEYWQDGRHNNANPGGTVCPAANGNQLYDYCYVDPNAKAATICRQEGSTGKPLVVHTSSQGGNRCGYEYYVLTCQ